MPQIARVAPSLKGKVFRIYIYRADKHGFEHKKCRPIIVFLQEVIAVGAKLFKLITGLEPKYQTFI